MVAITLTSRWKKKKKKNSTKVSQKNIEKRIFETRIRIEKQSNLSEIVATTLTSRDNTVSVAAAAVVSILPSWDSLVYPDIPSAALPHEKYIEQNANEADKEVHDFRCQPTTCKTPRAPCPRKQPGRRMHIRHA